MHIVYLHQYFTPPDGAGSTRSYEMARRLVEAGHKITLVTSNAFFPSNYQFDQLVTDLKIDGIKLRVIRVAYSNRQSYFRRIFAFFQFAFLSAIIAIRIRNVDLVFATSTPLTIMIPGIAVKWYHAAPMVFEVRDQWPRVPITLGILKNPLAIAAAQWMERAAYRNATHIVALSPCTRDGIIALGVNQNDITVIPNCADTDLFRVDSDVGEKFINEHPYLQNKKIVAYVGTLGLANGVDYIVQLAARMKDRDPNIYFVIVGDGAKRDQIAKIAGELDVFGKNFWMLPPLPKNQVPPVLSAATAVCSTFIIDAAPWPNSANKFFDGMAAGKPIIINYLGWQKGVLDQSGAGITLPPDDLDRAVEELELFLNDDTAVAKCSAASSLLADTRYNRALLAGKLRYVLEKAAATSHQYDLTEIPCEQRIFQTSISQANIKRTSPSQQKQ